MIRLVPALLLAVVLIAAVLAVRRRRRRDMLPPAMEQIPSPGPARLPDRVTVGAALADMPVLSDSSEVADGGDLDAEDWKMLVAVLNGQGQGLYAGLLAKDGRFKTRNGTLFTLYRCVATVNGARQSVCVIVKIAQLGHITARRLIVGLDRKMVMFTDEPRVEATGSHKGISYGQATNADAARMEHMSSGAVLLFAHELVSASRQGDLVSVD